MPRASATRPLALLVALTLAGRSADASPSRSAESNVSDLDAQNAGDRAHAVAMCGSPPVGIVPTPR